MAAPNIVARRLIAKADSLVGAIRDGRDVRKNVNDLGGAAVYCAPILDGSPTDPDPWLNATELDQGLGVVNQIDVAVAANADLQRLILTPQEAVTRSRSAIRTVHDRIGDIRQTISDLDQVAGGAQSWFASDPEVGTTMAANLMLLVAQLKLMVAVVDTQAANRRLFKASE
jgi:hypothetical protein